MDNKIRTLIEQSEKLAQRSHKVQSEAVILHRRMLVVYARNDSLLKAAALDGRDAVLDRYRRKKHLNKH